MSQKIEFQNRKEIILIIPIILIFISLFSYCLSSLESRIILIATFSSILIAIAVASYYGKEKTIIIVLFLASLLFLLWRSSYISPYYIEKTLHSRWYLFAQDYMTKGHFVFDEEHSYFFGSSLIIHSVREICGFSLVESIYFSLIVYAFFATLVAVKVLRVIRRRTIDNTKNERLPAILPSFVALSLLSFSYSERSIVGGGGFVPLGLLLMILMLSFLFDKGLRKKSDVVIVILIVIGVTLSSTDGILLMIPFFLFFSIPSKTRSTAVNALIPLSYMVFAGYSYMTFLKSYVKFAGEGFWEFLQKFLSGQRWERVIPWQRTASMTREDTMATSVAYISLIILCALIAIISTYLLIRHKTKQDSDDNPDMNTCVRSNLTCLWIMLLLAGATYIGTSMRPEVSFSDIRTIAIVFPTWFLPLAFVFKRLTKTITKVKVLYLLVIVLIVLASLRTGLETGYPKSMYDPINVVEDVRLGNNVVYVAGDFISEHYPSRGIIADYKVSNRLSKWLYYSNYEWQSLDESTLIESFAKHPEQSILAFDIAGINYPSSYHQPEAYSAAYSISMTNNRLYDNGFILIVSAR